MLVFREVATVVGIRARYVLAVLRLNRPEKAHPSLCSQDKEKLAKRNGLGNRLARALPNAHYKDWAS